MMTLPPSAVTQAYGIVEGGRGLKKNPFTRGGAERENNAVTREGEGRPLQIMTKKGTMQDHKKGKLAGIPFLGKKFGS